MQEISVVVPIPPHQPYYAHTIIANVFETSGVNPKDIDFVYLVQKDIHPELAKAFIELKKKFNFRIILAPFNSNLHLNLIDFAMRYGNLKNWVFLQHCDTFWKGSDWIVDTLEVINGPEHVVAIGPIGNGQKYFTRDGVSKIILHDYVGAYHKQTLLDKNLHFNWGEFNKLVSTDLLKKEVKDRRWYYHAPKICNTITEDTRMDGSWMISLHLYAHGHTCKYLPYDDKLYHLGHFLRVTNNIKSSNGYLKCHNMKHDYEYAGVFSWISSTCFDLKANSDHVFPFAVWKSITNKTLSADEMILCELMSRYIKPSNCLGLENNYGVNQSIFENKSFIKNKELNRMLI